MSSNWYVDSSVVLRAIIENSSSAREWLAARMAGADVLLASKLLELETRRVIHNAGFDQSVLSDYLDDFVFLAVNDSLLDEAISLPAMASGADSIHIASALRIGPSHVQVATHDRQMATAAQSLGFKVIDPVTDDPNRSPVA